MSNPDFFRDLQPEVAAEVEALARLQYELREAGKAALAAADAASADALLHDIAAGRRAEDEDTVAIRASVLQAESERVRAVLAARLRGTMLEDDSPHACLVELVEQRHADRYPGGALRRLDAVELLDVDGVGMWLRMASPACWEAAWLAPDNRDWRLSRLSATSPVLYRAPDRLPRPIDLPLTDVPVLLGWLLDTLATGPDAFDSLHDS